jgi:hypothetical protein
VVATRLIDQARASPHIGARTSTDQDRLEHPTIGKIARPTLMSGWFDAPPDRRARCDTVRVSEGFDRKPIHAELERVREDLHRLVAHATASDLRRGTDGTRWTNGQLLWHMAFGYLIVWRLLPGVRLFGRLPDGYSRRFAAALNVGTRPFHVINYLGACAGALVYRGPRLTRMLDRIVDRLHCRLDAETEESLGRQMHFPVRWDPFFADAMTVADVYHYGTQHYDFHRAQLTLEPAP